MLQAASLTSLVRPGELFSSTLKRMNQHQVGVAVLLAAFSQAFAPMRAQVYSGFV